MKSMLNVDDKSIHKEFGYITCGAECWKGWFVCNNKMWMSFQATGCGQAYVSGY